MKAVTVWQPWASLIIALAKPDEFRGGDYRDPRKYRGGPKPGERIVIHAGARKINRAEVQDLLLRIRAGESSLVVDLALPIVERALTTPGVFPLAAGLGTAIIGVPQRVTDLFAGIIDSDRLDHSKWAWPLGDIRPFVPIVPMRGAQGFWEWPEKVAA
jgi:hypothetical protein